MQSFLISQDRKITMEMIEEVINQKGQESEQQKIVFETFGCQVNTEIGSQLFIDTVTKLIDAPFANL